MDEKLFLPSDFHFVWSSLPEKKLQNMKDHFLRCLEKMIEWEKHEVAAQGIMPTFTDEMKKQVVSWAERCKNFYQLECLKKCIFDENVFPNSWEDIEKGADCLRMTRDEVIADNSNN